MSDQPAILCLRSSNGLQGASAFDQERLERYPYGGEIEVTVKQKRHGPRHRFYFAILGAALPNLREGLCYPSVDLLHDEIKRRLGYRESVALPQGTQFYVHGPDAPILVTLTEEVTAFRGGSIAFDKMDDATFAEFLRLALDLIQAEFVPGVDIEQLKREAKRSLGRTYRKGTA